jgi:hypothetical protein
MFAGILVGGTIWATYFFLFLVFPAPISLAAALCVGPYAGGYFAARLSGSRAASVVIVTCSIAALALSVTYVRATSWEYPHHLWAGVPLLIALLVLGNCIFICAGTLTGIRVRQDNKLSQRALEGKAMEPEREKVSRQTGHAMPDLPQTKAADLEMKRRNLQNALKLIKEKNGLEEISPELLTEKRKVLEEQLLEVILEQQTPSRQAV